MSDNTNSPTSSSASPTGLPVIPPVFVPPLVALIGLAGVGSQMLPPHTIAFKVSSIILALGTALGLASPGLRRGQ